MKKPALDFGIEGAVLVSGNGLKGSCRFLHSRWAGREPAGFGIGGGGIDGLGWSWLSAVRPGSA
jgi:hypothetical protein